MSESSDFNLTPSPADPQPVKVFALDDCTWWAGYSLQQCIEQARAEHGEDCYEDAEQDGAELTDHEMRTLFFVDPELEVRRTFAEELAVRVAAGERFPQMFASTEY